MLTLVMPIDCLRLRKELVTMLTNEGNVGLEEGGFSSSSGS
jgi:hypothetical protein